MKNREKFIFWFLLLILVISRIINIINTHRSAGLEQANLFISSHIASGVLPSPLLFQINKPHVGGGHLLYNIMASPFLLLFGNSYFSLRLASIAFLILTYLVTYRFCNRYFGFITAAFASFLFVITPGLLTKFSIVGEGRYFHLNLFFILSLYCISKIKDRKKLLYYLLFGVTCGLGVYFYPAFLVTVFVYGLFLLFDLDIRKPSTIYGYLLVIVCVILAGNFLQFQTPWHLNFYRILTLRAKNIIISGDIFEILNRSATLFLKIIPNIFVNSSKKDFLVLFRQPFNEYFYVLTSVPRISLEIFRLIFISSCVSLCWINSRGLKKATPNAFSLRSKYVIPTRGYIAIFLLAHLFIYIFLYSFNGRAMDKYDFYVPLFLNIILIIAIFLSQIWQRSKSLSIILLIFALSPGIIYQYHNLTEASMKDFYKHYIYFYREKAANELLMNKPISVHKNMCDKLNINICKGIGWWYVGKSLDEVQKDFEYLSGGDMRKLRYLYQGYIYQKVIKSKGKIKRFSSLSPLIEKIEKIDKKYQKFCYIGLGEGLFALANLGKNEFAFEKHKKIIEEYNPLVEEAYKRYFFQGIGEALAKMFARPYSPYITDTGLYDYKILENYFKMIDDKECRKAFLTGFCNKDIWAPY